MTCTYKDELKTFSCLLSRKLFCYLPGDRSHTRALLPARTFQPRADRHHHSTIDPGEELLFSSRPLPMRSTGRNTEKRRCSQCGTHADTAPGWGHASMRTFLSSSLPGQCGWFRGLLRPRQRRLKSLVLEHRMRESHQLHIER